MLASPIPVAGAMAAFRVFLSAVSSEFGQARRELRHDFGTRRMDVATQEELSHLTGAGSLLALLDTHIHDCTGVVCVIGRRSGAGFPTPTEAEPYAALLPRDMPRASYTQWEFLLARKHGKPMVVCCPRPGVAPDIADTDLDPPDDSALQATFVRHLVEVLGVPRIPFSDTHELCRVVMRQPWVAPPPDKAVVLPYPTLGTLFKGRTAFMARLRASLLRPDGRAAIAGRAVHGLGGVGKTRAAVEYAWAHRDDYIALALLDAETPEKLHTGLAALTGPLRLPEAAIPEEPARMEAALAWLNANPGWFLILDNIDSTPALDAANRLLGRLHGGHVVLTSRLSAGFARGVERLDLDVLTLDDAASFLLEATDSARVKATDDPAQARALAADLGQLALALEMAAATIEARQFSFAAYRTQWQGNRARVVGWARQAVTGYHHAVAETWQTSVDQLTADGRALLERLAFLAPDPVPAFLLDAPDAESGAAALDDLATYSLVTRDPASGSVLVHRLVQDVTRRGLAAAGTATARLTEALGWVNDAFTGDPQDVRSWGRLDPLAPHAEAVAGYADAAGIGEPTARLMNELGVLFQTRALFARAEPLKRRALGIDEASFGPDHPNVAIRLNNLALLLQATTRLGEAEPLMRRALGIDEASLGPDHPNVAIRLNNLATLLQDTNRLDDAEPLMRRALCIGEASFGPDHPNVATALNNLARLLQDTNRLAEAEPLMRRALGIDEASFGPDHPNVAIDLNNLARLLQHTNRLGEAEPLMRRALAILCALEAAIGRSHPWRERAQGNYARLLAALGRGEAETAAAIADVRRAAGLDAPSDAPPAQAPNAPVG